MADIELGGGTFAAVMTSTLTCPHCGDKRTLEMPSDACVAFEHCPACGATIRPNAGDCCVFCSFGDAPCPPIQEARAQGRTCDCC
jgi:hypothetical protein